MNKFFSVIKESKTISEYQEIRSLYPNISFVFLNKSYFTMNRWRNTWIHRNIIWKKWSNFLSKFSKCHQFLKFNRHNPLFSCLRVSHIPNICFTIFRSSHRIFVLLILYFPWLNLPIYHPRTCIFLGL